MHLEAIDVDLWYVVKNGVPKTGEGVNPADVKKFIQLDLLRGTSSVVILPKGSMAEYVLWQRQT